MDFNFKAPLEIELEIVEYSLNKLNLNLDDFWYNWFLPNNPTTRVLHFVTNVKIDTEQAKDLVKSISSLKVIKIFEVIGGSLPEEEDFKYLYRIHFKIEL